MVKIMYDVEKEQSLKEMLEKMRKSEAPDCIVESFEDYGSSYICDAIMEMADDHIDIYWSDLIAWVQGNESYVEEALNEFGWKHGDDFYCLIQKAQYVANEEEIYQHLDEIILTTAYDWMIENFEEYDWKEETTIEDLVEAIENAVSSIDSNDRVDRIYDNLEEEISYLYKDEDDKDE